MPKATASSIAATFKKSEKVRTEQRCASVGDASGLARGVMGGSAVATRRGCSGGDGGAEGVAASSRSGSRARCTSRLAHPLKVHDCLSTSTADSASLRAIASTVVRWG
eukprot:6212706-Pleurochrysis_carterae.AAC.3